MYEFNTVAVHMLLAPKVSEYKPIVFKISDKLYRKKAEPIFILEVSSPTGFCENWLIAN